MRFFLILLPSLLLGGCGLINGESDYVPYATTLQSHSDAEARRIASQSQAIVNSLLTANPETRSEKTLLAVIAMLQIERLMPVPLGIVKPITGYDVLDHNIPTVASALLTGTLGYFSYDAIKTISAVGGNTFNDQVNATGAFNNSELHQTYSSGATGSLAPSTVKPEIVRPEVVSPEVVNSGVER